MLVGDPKISFINLSLFVLLLTEYHRLSNLLKIEVHLVHDSEDWKSKTEWLHGGNVFMLSQNTVEDIT